MYRRLPKIETVRTYCTAEHTPFLLDVFQMARPDRVTFMLQMSPFRAMLHTVIKIDLEPVLYSRQGREENTVDNLGDGASRPLYPWESAICILGSLRR